MLDTNAMTFTNWNNVHVCNWAFFKVTVFWTGVKDMFWWRMCFFLVGLKNGKWKGEQPSVNRSRIHREISFKLHDDTSPQQKKIRKAWKLNPVKAFQFMFIQHCRLSSALHLHLNKEVSIKELLNYLGVSLGQCEKTVKTLLFINHSGRKFTETSGSVLGDAGRVYSQQHMCSFRHSIIVLMRWAVFTCLDILLNQESN